MIEETSPNQVQPQSRIPEQEYRIYMDALLAGDRRVCWKITETILAKGMGHRDIYIDLFQKSLYEVGVLWESNQISVATEHMATSITEGLMGHLFESLITGDPVGRSVVVTSIESELHQIGGKMIADTFEMAGWRSYYLGASTKHSDLLSFIKEKDPDLVGLSISISSHMPLLEQILKDLTDHHPEKLVLIGGQALQNSGKEVANKYRNVVYVKDLVQLWEKLKQDPRSIGFE